MKQVLIMVKINNKKLQHVCYLMDGTRTYQAFKKTPYEKINEKAYYSGMNKLHNIMNMSFIDFNIRFLTVNIIGRENVEKRKDSATSIADIFPYFFLTKWKEYLIKNKVRVRFIGDLDLFCNSATNPDKVRETLNLTEKYTKKFHDHYLILMLAYEPSYEYLRIIKNNIRAGSKKDLVRKYYGFYVPDVNLIIRTWRPKLSGCVPLFVSEYADIYFFPAPFMYFNRSTYKIIFEDYLKRIESSNKVPTKLQIKELYNAQGRLSKKPLPLGELVGGRWFPIYKK